MKAVKIVGAGLVGSFLGILLKRRGLDVEIFERRADPRRKAMVAGRSINLIITSRGLHGLEKAGLKEKALSLSSPVFGRMIHALDGSTVYQPYGREGDCNHSISRAELNHFLMDAAEKAGVKIHFDHALENLDLQGKTALFATPKGNVTAKYELVIGADGAGSRVRKSLCDQQSQIFQERIDWLEADYKELFLPAGANGQSLLKKDALHIWPRGAVMMMALANLDGSFTVTLYMPKTDRLLTFDKIKTGKDLENLFAQQFPDAIPLMPDREKDFFANPQGALGTVRLKKWVFGDSVALMGDAAHAIVPFFGQGMNCAFEDATCLDRMIEKGLTGEKLLLEYERERLPNAHAISDMAVENWYEMADRVADKKFQLRKSVEAMIEKRYPERYRSRYGMICYTLIPYATAQETGHKQAAFLDALCAGIEKPEDVNWAAVEAGLDRI